MAGFGFHSVVPNRVLMCTAVHGIPRYLDRDCQGENDHTAYCHRQEENLRADCQGVIPAVANRGIGAQFATTE
jgi:hypothetical protein